MSAAARRYPKVQWSAATARHRVGAMSRAPRAALRAVLCCAALLLSLPLTAQAATGLDRAAGPFASDAVAALTATAAAPDPGLPSGFTDDVVWSGLTEPTAVRWAPDGHIFVAQKTGVVDEFDSVNDKTPTVYVDLSHEVDDFLDRGLLGLAVDPKFTTGRPYIYVLYTYDKDPNSTRFPAWNDDCPDPPGADSSGCPAVGRLSRIDPDGTEHVLVQDWCAVYSTHTIGDLHFGPDGALYASGGDGASYTRADYGQGGGAGGTPDNACGDPPVPVGGDQSPPTAEGGALRSQSFRRAAGEPVSLDGSIIRVNPDTGDALPDNPAASDPNANRRRIVAYGFRNPFRFTFRPGTGELWAGDVGWNTWEEFNRDPDTTTVRNFGWPCYEGDDRVGAYDTLNLNACETLYAAGTATGPWFKYQHDVDVGTCSAGSSSATGVAFYTGGQFPAAYRNGLFVSDYARECIMFFPLGSDGSPDPTKMQVFADHAGALVDLQVAPDGAIYYPDIATGTVDRISYPAGNHTPTAKATATPDHGPTPLTVSFDASGSSDPDGTALTYSWDLDGDGTFGDSTAVKPTHTYTTPGDYTVRVQVTDPGGLTDVASIPIRAGDPPVPVIDSPSAALTWATGDTIAYAGHATDGQGNALPASALSWQLNVRHCGRIDPTSCHTHFGNVVSGAASGTFVAPNHDWPAHLELILTATDGHGLSSTTTVALQPRTVQLTLTSDPTGAELTMGADTGTTPFTETFIQNSTTDITAPTPQTIGTDAFQFDHWSDGGAITHTITIPSTDSTFKASFVPDTSVTLGGAEVTGTTPSTAPPGAGEVYKLTAAKTGTVNRLRLYVDGTTTATAFVLGLYADASNKPGALLGSAQKFGPVPGAWNEVTLPTPIPVTAGSSYWFALLNPVASDGALVWRDHAGGSGGGEQTSADRALTALPAAWTAGGTFSDGPVSGYLVGQTGGAQTPPALSVSPASLSFNATIGAGNPADKSLSITNGGSGTLNYTISDDASWLTVTPSSASAPGTATVSVDPTGLTAGTYAANITVAAGSATGSPAVIAVTFTLNPASTGGSTTLAGSDQTGTDVSQASAGGGEVYKISAAGSGTAAKLSLYVDGGSTAGKLVLGLYSDVAGKPGALLGSGRISSVTPGAWNDVPLDAGIPLTVGTSYWFGLLNPSDSGGTLKWRDHAGGKSGSPEQTSQARNLTVLPATWATGGSFTDGPVAGYAAGASGPPPPATLSVSPASLTFSGVAGGASPAAKTLSIANTGGGTLTFTAGDDAAWLSESPAGGTAPQDVSVSVDTSGLSAGTYTGTITIDGGSISGSPKTIPVTLTLTPPSPPVLAVSPGSLTYTAVQGGAAPAAQSLSVTNTGSGTLSYTATDDQPWLSETGASGTAPGTVSVSADPSGLAAGTYTGTVTVTAAGATGSPKTVAVSLTVTPPSSGLVGAWSFDETTGTSAGDASGKGNTGTINGATHTTAGKFGGALTFNGTSNWVTVPDSASLHLTTGLTVEGWVNPTASGTTWRALAVKETATGLAWALYPFGDGAFPSAHAFTATEQWAKGPTKLTLNTWTHVAETYDGTTIRLFVNGVQVATKAQTGPLVTSTQPLRFGGDALWAEWFKGMLDELRVYDHALTAAQIQSDMATRIGA